MSFNHNFQWSFFFFLSLVFFFFRASPAKYGGSRLGAELELKPPAYATATAAHDPSRVWDLYSSLQHQILNPLSEARDQTRVLMDASRLDNHWAMPGILLVKISVSRIIQFRKVSNWQDLNYFCRRYICERWVFVLLSFFNVPLSWMSFCSLFIYSLKGHGLRQDQWLT